MADIAKRSIIVAVCSASAFNCAGAGIENEHVVEEVIAAYFEMRNLRPQAIAEYSGAWDEGEWFERAIMYVESGSGILRLNMYKFDEAAHEMQRYVDECDPYVMVEWDGERWIELNGEGVAAIRGTFSISPEYDCLSMLLDAELPTFVHAMSNRDIGAMFSDDVPTLAAGETAEVVMESPGTNRIAVSFSELSVHVPARVEYSIYDSAEALRGRDAKTVVEFSGADWHRFGERVIPAVGFRDGYLLRRTLREAQSKPPVVSRTVFRRMGELHAGVSKLDRLCGNLPAGTMVLDERAMLKYVIGGRVIEVDGAEYEVNEPIVGDPIAQLPEIMRGARPIDHSADRRSRESGASGFWTSQRTTRILVSIVVGVAICALVFIVVSIQRR